MRATQAVLIIIPLLVSGCITVPESETYCETNDDCIPKPGCHPYECINKAYEDSYEHPEICTMVFDCSAAYKTEDCNCINQECINMNLNNKGCS